MSAGRDIGLNVPASAYPYLQMQRGAISDMRDDQAVWLQHYADALFSEFDRLEPYLPKQCDSILDVGSGLGGIDILLNRYYGGDCHVTLLDGVDDKPFVERHAATFNSMAVAREFLGANGVARIDHIDANAAHRAAPRFFDLVVSFKSWCFHYEPAAYMWLVKGASISRRTKIILDIRRERADWFTQLSTEFRYVDMIYTGTKFHCAVFEAR